MTDQPTGFINQDTPLAKQIKEELKSNRYNLYVRIRIESYRQRDYRDLCTGFWQDSNVVHLFFSIEGDRGKKNQFHMHLLIQSVTPSQTLNHIKQFTDGDDQVWIEYYKTGYGCSEEYSAKYIGNEGIDYECLDHDFFYRYQYGSDLEEIFRELSNEVQFNRKQICELAGIERAQFYRDKKRFDLKPYKGRIGIRTWYLRREVIRYLEERGTLIRSDNQPVDKDQVFKEHLNEVRRLTKRIKLREFKEREAIAPRMSVMRTKTGPSQQYERYGRGLE